MHPIRTLINTLFIFSILITACAGPTQVTVSPPLPTPTIKLFPTHTPQPAKELPIKLAWFYKPPSDGNLVQIASRFNFFILTKGDEYERDQLFQLGARQPILQYLRFDAIQDPGSCTAQPWRNQVAYMPGDFCQISAEHPDWFLRDKNGNKINQPWEKQNFFMMDPGNPGWREFWLARALQSQAENGWQGVFLDNVEASLDKLDSLAGENATYKTDAAYQSAISGFLGYIYKGYFQPQGRPLFANIIEIKDAGTWNLYLQSLDGAMLENFAVGWNNGVFFNPLQWEQDIKYAELAQAQGKQVVLISQGNRNDLARQQFAFASYLLAANGLASFRYASADHYDEAWMYDDYNLKLGAPLGPRYQEGIFWKRDFQNGSISVNLVTRSAEIKIK
jgi:hypothetical protein